jgi:hypothetical protein
MKRQLKIALTLFWVIVISALVYWLFIPHWTTYTNQEYGFSISIPENFEIRTDQPSVNNDTSFNFFVVDPKGQEYLNIKAYNKPNDFVEPTGPFPMTTSNVKEGYTTDTYTYNRIAGLIIDGGYEGATGNFKYFQFLRDGKVWRIEFIAEEGNYLPKNFNESVYKKIRDSFKLI